MRSVLCSAPRARPTSPGFAGGRIKRLRSSATSSPSPRIYSTPRKRIPQIVLFGILPWIDRWELGDLVRARDHRMHFVVGCICFTLQLQDLCLRELHGGSCSLRPCINLKAYQARADEDRMATQLQVNLRQLIRLRSHSSQICLINGKWELLYTTSRSILQTQRPKFLRPNEKIYQAINTETLRAQNMETWPYFNQVTTNLVPLNERRVAVRFDTSKSRISRGDKRNFFILKMVDPTYRVPI